MKRSFAIGRRTTLLAVVAGVAVIAAACGGGDTSSSQPAPAPAPAPSGDASPAPVDNWSPGTIRWIVPSSAGGGFDLNTRNFAPSFGEALGTNFAIENIPGGNFAIGTLEALRSGGADQCETLLTHGAELMTIASLLDADPQYSTADFVAVGGLTLEEYVFRVNENTPWNSVTELVADAKSRPGQIRYGVGSITDSIGFRRFMIETGTEFAVILYDGGGEARLGMRNGEIEVAHIGVFNGLAVEDVSRVIGVDARENRWPEYTDNATPINQQLGTNLDTWSNSNGFFVTKSCVDNHPQRYQRLVDAFTVAADDPAYLAQLEATNVADLRFIQPGSQYADYVDGLRDIIGDVLSQVDLG
jgi:tripartite-type tricarboxylate transporter receptor subunit TctC